MTARSAARAFHQFGNMLLAIAALSFVALPLVEAAKLMF